MTGGRSTSRRTRSGTASKNRHVDSGSDLPAKGTSLYERAYRAIRQLAGSGPGETGEAFFHEASSAIASALDADAVIVGVLTPSGGDAVEVVAIATAEAEREPAIRRLAPGLCRLVIEKGHVTSGPGDGWRLLVGPGAADLDPCSFCGVSILGGDGQSQGAVAVVFRRTVERPDEVEIALLAFAERIGRALVQRPRERTLDADETCSRALIEAIPDLVYRVDSAGTVLDCRAPARSPFGDPTAVIGTRLADAPLPPPLKKVVKQRLLQTLRTGKVQREEVEFPLGGESRAFEVAFSRCAPDQAMILVRETTERRQAEDRLLARTRFLDSVLSSLTHPFYVINARDHTIALANPASGLEGDVPGRTCYAATHHRSRPCDEDGLPCPLAEMRRSKRPATVEHSHFGPRGEERILEVHGYPIFDADGEVAQMIEYSLDVTDRKLAEAALRQSETRYRSLFEHSPIGKYRTTLDGRILLANRALVEKLGYDSIEDLARLDISRDGFAPGNSRRSFIEAIEPTGEVTGFESAWLTKDGRLLQFRESARAIRDASGRTIYYEGTAEDVTAQRRAETELRESEARFRMLADTAPVLIWLADTTGACTFFNKPWLDFTGQPLERQVGEGWVASVHPDDVEACVSDYTKAFREQRSFRLEYRLRRADGVYRWVLDNGVPRTLEDGSFAGYIGSAIDITERRQAEEALRRNEEHLRLVYENSPLAYQSLDADGRYVDVNPAWCRLLGFQRSEVVGASFVDILTPESRALMTERFPRFLAAGEIHGVEFEVVSKAGSHLQIELDGKIGYNADGSFRQTHCLLHDITARKQAERALRESEERYRLIAENTADTIAVWDLDLKPKYISPSVEKLRGYTAEEAMGIPLDRVLTTSSMQTVRRVIAEQSAIEARGDGDPLRTVRLEIEEYHKDGTTRWVELTASFLRDHEGRLTGILTVARDITERKRSERDLAESERKFRSLAESSPDNIVRYDRDRRLTYANRNVDLTTNLNLGSRIGERPEDEPEFEAAAQYFAVLRNTIVTGEPGKVEFPIANPSGEIRTHHVRFVAERSHDGLIVGALAIGRDITERKRDEEALRESEEKYRSIFEESFDGLFVTSPEGRVLDMNKKGIEMLGYDTKEEVQRLDLSRDVYANPSERDRILAMVEASGGAEYEVVVKKRSGERMFTHCSLAPVLDRTGLVSSYRGIIRDITERRRLEEEMRRAAAVMQQAAEAIIITDTQGTIVYVNPAFTSITGYPADEAIGRNPRFLSSGKHDKAFYQRLWTSLQRGETWHGRFQNRKKDGTVYEEEASITPVRDETGQVAYFVGVKRDISHEVALQEQLLRAQKMEALGQFASGVAHDFNNLIMVILGATELLGRASSLDQQSRTELALIHRTSEKAAELSRGLLAFSRRQLLQVEPVDLGALVLGVVPMLRRLLPESIEVETESAERVVVVRADSGQIEQVIMNLAVNARDAMPSGGLLRFRVSCATLGDDFVAAHPWAERGEFGALEVRDSGHGIDPETLARIFDPFFTTKAPGKGTGLGLATVYGIVKQHRGFVDVKSDLGAGTAFTVYLPRARSGSDAVDAPGEPVRETAQVHERIMLVEDHADLRNVVARHLRELGYEVREAADGVEALQVLREEGSFDLVMSDVIMPRMGGLELLDAIRTEAPKLAFLLSSGYSGDDQSLSELPRDPRIGFLSKPYSTKVLAVKLRELLDQVERPAHAPRLKGSGDPS